MAEEDNFEDVYHLYSDSQKKALAWVTYFVSLPSLVGSCIIIWVIYYDRHELWGRRPVRGGHHDDNSGGSGNNSNHTRRRTGSCGVYYRLLLGLSCMDVLFSGGLIVFGSWAVPAGSHLAYGESGNRATCTAAGVALTFMAGCVLYNAFLAMYHALLVRFQVSEEVIARRWEPFFHLIAISSPIAISVVGAVKGYMNPLYATSGYCWLGDSPPRCSKDEDVECIRGENYQVLSRAVILCVFGLSFLCILVCMVLIVCKVRATELRLRLYQHGDDMPELKLTKAAGKQGLKYIGSFLASFIWTVVLSLLTHEATRENRHIYFPLSFMAKFFAPLQGFFNVFIFLSTRFEKLSQEGRSLHFVKRLADAWSSSFRINRSRRNSFQEEGDDGNSHDGLDHQPALADGARREAALATISRSTQSTVSAALSGDYTSQPMEEETESGHEEEKQGVETSAGAIISCHNLPTHQEIPQQEEDTEDEANAGE